MKAKSYIPALAATTLIGVSALALSGNAIAAGTSSGLSSNSMSSNNGHMMANNSMSHNGMSGSMSKSRVKSIQRALKKNGMDVNTDGVMGPHTKSALRQYQQKHNLKVTGQPDRATCKSLGVGMGNSGMSGNSMSGNSMSGNSSW